MNDEELHQRLRRIDPAHRASTDPVAGPRAAVLMEQIMHTPYATPETELPRQRPARRWMKFAVAGTAVAVLAGGAFALTSGDDGRHSSTSVAYSLPTPRPGGTSCLNLDGYQPPAGLIGLRGTVLSIVDGKVTLTVSKWFAGGDADQVVLNGPANVPNGIGGGIEFVVGQDYLVAVSDGEVQTCGVSGPVDPALEALYARWFAA